MYNIGGIRSAFAKGDVTYGDVLDVAPFENKICFVTLTGDRVLELFGQIAAAGGEGVSHGVELVITKDGGLKSARLDGKDIDPNAKYRVATLDYVAQGNDNMAAFKAAIDVKSPQSKDNNVRFIIMKYMKEKMSQGISVSSRIEGRIKTEENETLYNHCVHGRCGHDNLAGKGQKLVILHTNDTHSCIYPLNAHLADTMLAGRGGFIRRTEMLRQERQRYPQLLLLDSGDFSQGSSYYTLYKGDVEVELMNLMGYDAATIGNHEFDFGVENMARLFRKAKFPIVCANYDFTGTPLEGIVKPYTVIRRDGLKIGVFGLSPQLDGLVLATSCAGVKYNDPVKAANDVARTLKEKEKCDVVICLSHLGWDILGLDDTELMPQVRNVDIVLGGHSHTYFEQMKYIKDLDGRDIPNDQNGKHGIFIGRIIVNLESK